jgi:hypothetical protein
MSNDTEHTPAAPPGPKQQFLDLAAELLDVQERLQTLITNVDWQHPPHP